MGSLPFAERRGGVRRTQGMPEVGARRLARRIVERVELVVAGWCGVWRAGCGVMVLFR